MSEATNLDVTNALASVAALAPETSQHTVNTDASFAESLGLPLHRDLASLIPSPKFLSEFGIAYARTHRVIGLQDPTIPNGPTTVAVCDHEGLQHLDVIGRAMATVVRPTVATAQAIDVAINKAYADRSSGAQQVIDSIDRDRSNRWPVAKIYLTLKVAHRSFNWSTICFSTRSKQGHRMSISNPTRTELSSVSESMASCLIALKSPKLSRKKC